MDDDEDEDDVGDDQSFASIDDLDGEVQFCHCHYAYLTVTIDEGATHLMELSKLAEKDPEFYKYLQENDRELLDFDIGQAEDDAEDMDDAGDSGRPQRAPALTTDTLRKWQLALLQVSRLTQSSPIVNKWSLQQHSLRALRKLLIAFRSAAHMNEEGEGMVWSIDSSTGQHFVA
jgi:nucleolar complex protein 2